jgi:sugar phosphate isomerase/epimerase
MKLRLACSDYTFPLLPHEHVFKLIAALGFEGVDVGLFEDRSHLQPSHVLPHLAHSANELSAKVRDQGLEFADVFYQASSFQDRAANDPDPEQRAKSRELFLRMLEFALRCNAHHVTGLPGIDWEGVPHDTSLKRAADELSWRAEQARQVGVVYSVEAHLGSVAPTPAAAKALIDLAPGLTLTLDYTHFVKQEFSQDECETLMPYAAHYHARGAEPGRLQASMRANRVDFKRVLQAMERANYRGYVGVEYVWTEWEHCDEVDNISETVLLRDQLRALMS